MTTNLLDSDFELLFRRVRCLERGARMRRLVVMLAAAFGAAAGSSAILGRVRASEDAKTNQLLSASALVLVDKTGQPRGTWAVLESGSVIMTMSDGAQNRRLALLVDGDGHTEIKMLDAKGQTRGTWQVSTNGETAFALADSQATARFGAKVEGTAAYWQLNDAGGKTRAMCSTLSALGSEKAELGFYDKSQKRRLALLTADDGTPVIVFPDTSDPAGVLGGWYTSGTQVATIPKGTFNKLLSPK